MKTLQSVLAVTCILVLITGAATLAADKPDAKPAKKLTCCEEAEAKGKECSHRCCLAAHRKGQSCEKCNPAKEDLKILKKKAAAATHGSAAAGQKPDATKPDSSKGAKQPEK